MRKRIAVTDTFTYIEIEVLVFTQKQSRILSGELADRLLHPDWKSGRA